jgi:chromosome segregation ATPase
MTRKSEGNSFNRGRAMRIEIKLPLIALCLLVALTAVAAAQQSPRRPTPTMTNEEMSPAKPAPEATQPPGAAKEAPAKGPPAAALQDPGDKERDAAERAWNERLSKAREKVKDLERRADQAELEVNRLRNFLFSAEPRDAGTNGQISARMSELSELSHRLRAEAKAAQEEVDEILSEGETRKFKVESLPPTTKTGAPNLEYYRSRSAELQSDLRDAEARAEVMLLRMRELRYRINGQSGSGDNFFLARLQGELQEAEQGLERARARITELSQQLEALRQQAAAAGVPLGELR